MCYIVVKINIYNFLLGNYFSLFKVILAQSNLYIITMVTQKHHFKI